MRVTDPKMMELMDRALRLGGNLFDMDDIKKGLNNGTMQGHVAGNTWAITQVHEWPRKRSVNILFVVGDMDGALKLEAVVEDWAKSIGADLLTAIGRDGWWENRTPGWNKMGVMYAKDIKS